MPASVLLALLIMVAGTTALMFPYLGLFSIIALAAPFGFVAAVKHIASQHEALPPNRAVIALIFAGQLALLAACILGSFGYGNYLWHRDSAVVQDDIGYRFSPVLAMFGAAITVFGVARLIGLSRRRMALWTLAIFACFPGTITGVYLVSRFWPLSA